MIRYWQLPGGLTTREEVDEPIGFNLFWYCYRCGDRYAQAWTVDSSIPWKALGGCCLRCESHRWIIPGTLESIMFVGWKVPLVVANYQLERELEFTRDPQHPYNEKECP